MLVSKLDHFLGQVPSEKVQLVIPKSRTGEQLGETYAKQRGYDYKLFPADWDTFGASAGDIRNDDMVSYSTHCVCFWDGLSSGTSRIISQAKELGLTLRVVRY